MKKIFASITDVTLFFLRYAESVGAKHYHTSAKQNKGIEELFLDLCKSRCIQTLYILEIALLKILVIFFK